ncbi:MAG TPA: PPOX class F420-dependent oxidoreductase [Solirubrobacteraceae bacterium]
MTDFPQSHRDLLDTQVASLATIGRDGIPQVTAVWFVHDNGELQLSLNSARLKTKNLQERPECSLMILDNANPYRYLEVRGHARLEPDSDDIVVGKINAKYSADVRAWDGADTQRMAVTIDPSNVYAVDMGG